MLGQEVSLVHAQAPACFRDAAWMLVRLCWLSLWATAWADQPLLDGVGGCEAAQLPCKSCNRDCLTACVLSFWFSALALATTCLLQREYFENNHWGTPCALLPMRHKAVTCFCVRLISSDGFACRSIVSVTPALDQLTLCCVVDDASNLQFGPLGLVADTGLFVAKQLDAI